MYSGPRTHWQMRAMNLAFVLLFLSAVGLLQWLSREYSLRFDLTEAGWHSLSEASVAVTQALEGPVRITAYARDKGELRRPIRELAARYQRHKSDLELHFVNPDREPEATRTAGVAEGDLVFEYGDSRETLPRQLLTEQHFTNLLQRLGRQGERWIVFQAGHGERSPDGPANFDLSTFAQELRARGFETRAHALAQLPRNTAVLVIAGPQVKLLPGEVKTIEDYLKRGGNLLWLHDPGPLHGLAPIAEHLGVEFPPGVILDRESADLTNIPDAVAIASYGAHPIVRNFDTSTFFVNAAALSIRDGDEASGAPAGWQAGRLLDTKPGAWVETGPMSGAVVFDAGKDFRGPLALGVALTRETSSEGTDGEKREQRVVIVGDGDFLSNSIVANGGNLTLGMNMVNWLSHDDAYVNIPVRTAADRTLNFTPYAQAGIAIVFLLVLPPLFIGTGVAIWWRRRKR